MSDLVEKVLETAHPLTQSIAALIGDLSASEITWIDNEARKHLFAAPVSAGDREKIARTICEATNTYWWQGKTDQANRENRCWYRAADAILAPPPTHKLHDPVDESFIDYAGMPEAEMLARIGSDGAKWAEAFCQTAYKLGIVIDDEGWMIGWFANAIEAGAQRERDRQLPGPVES